MRMGAKESLTTYQAAVLVSNFILGVGILTVPRTATEKVKTPDIWLSVIIGGLIAMLAGVIIVKLSQQFPEKTFYEYSEHIVGKWLGCMLNLLVIGYFVATSSHMVRALAEVTTLFLLEGTPHWAIIMAFMWVRGNVPKNINDLFHYSTSLAMWHSSCSGCCLSSCSELRK